MQFDARTAKILAPGAHMTLDGYPGLRLESTASRKTWTYRFKSPVDGRMRQVAIGQWPALSMPAAVGAWESLKAERDAGRDPAKEKRAAKRVEAVERRSDAYTVADVCSDYLRGHVERHRKARGAAEVKRTFDTMLGAMADREAKTITRADAFDLIEQFRDVPVQASKLRLELGGAWDYALDAGRLPETSANWWRQILRGKLRSKGRSYAGKKRGAAKRALSEAEVAEVLRFLPNWSDVVRDVLQMYLWTGARGGEVVAMERHEITEEASGLWWTVPKEKTKNARHANATDQRVPLVGRAETIVRARMDAVKRGYLFPSRTAPHIEQESVGDAVRYFQPYCKLRKSHERPRLAVTHWSPHDLRRTVRTILPALGCPEAVAEAVLGHMPPGVQGVYNLYQYDAERREWLGRLAERLESLAVG